MFGKIEIHADLKLVSGLHIGGSKEFSAIGAIDSPVIRDAFSKEPIIPGSSIKGKMRTLLVKTLTDSVMLPECNDDPEEIIRLFGGSEKVKIGDKKRIPQARLQFFDCFMKNVHELFEKDISLTEVKFENNINRITAVANPRQIERVVRGSIFDFKLIYNAEKKEDILEDIKNIYNAIKLLELDYLGGSGSRGYGKVAFENLEAKVVYGELDEEIKEQISELFVD